MRPATAAGHEALVEIAKSTFKENPNAQIVARAILDACGEAMKTVEPNEASERMCASLIGRGIDAAMHSFSVIEHERLIAKMRDEPEVREAVMIAIDLYQRSAQLLESALRDD